MPMQTLEQFEKRFRLIEQIVGKNIEKRVRLIEEHFEEKVERPFRLIEQSIGRNIETRLRRFEQKNGIRLNDEVRFIGSWIKKPLSMGAVTPSSKAARPRHGALCRPGRRRAGDRARPRHGPITEALVEQRRRIRPGSCCSSSTRRSASCCSSAFPRRPSCRPMPTGCANSLDAPDAPRGLGRRVRPAADDQAAAHAHAPVARSASRCCSRRRRSCSSPTRWCRRSRGSPASRSRRPSASGATCRRRACGSTGTIDLLGVSLCGIPVFSTKTGRVDLPPEPRDRLIVALDLPGVREADAMVERLGDAATFYKVGYQLAFAGGLPSSRA